MTGKEWSKLCKEHGVVVLDANYKDMTQDDALKYFDLLKTAMDHAFARKYDLETGQYWKLANMKITHCLKGLHITKMI